MQVLGLFNNTEVVIRRENIIPVIPEGLDRGVSDSDPYLVISDNQAQIVNKYFY